MRVEKKSWKSCVARCVAGQHITAKGVRYEVNVSPIITTRKKQKKMNRRYEREKAQKMRSKNTFFSMDS